MTDKEKIKAEIERLKQQLLFIEMSEQMNNSLPEEPVSEDLVYAAERYACKFSDSKYGFDKMRNAFIVGAHWKKDQFIEKASKFIRTPNIYVVDFNKNGGATTNYEKTVEKFKKYMEDNHEEKAI